MLSGKLTYSPRTIYKGQYEKCSAANRHYRRRLLCRVSQTLSSAFYQALGKEAVCRVPERKHSANNWHSANNNTRQKPGLPSVGHSANQNTQQRATAVNGRQPPLTLAKCLLLTLGKMVIYRVSFFDTR